MKRIYLETFGCQMNVLDSELLQSQLTRLGYTFTPHLEEAEVVLYNTCSVRDLAEQKVLSRLGRMRKRKQEGQELVVGVIGCMAERDGVGMLKRLPYVDLLCGPGELDALPGLLERALATGRQQHALAGNTARRGQTGEARVDALETLDLGRAFSATENRYQAYVRVVRGCNKFCTYCVVPYTRGPESSRAPEAILEESRKLVAAGCREITLLGQTVNHYAYEGPVGEVSTATGPTRKRTTFAGLLALLHEGLPDLPRLRFLTSFPADFANEVLQVMAECPRICRYLHIPAQSGSNRILKLMNRGYTVESYLDLLERARSMVPGVAFAGDFIVGFPTESDEDHAASRRLVEQAQYKNCFIFKYSPRPGTLAIKRYSDDVPEEVKGARNQDLLKLQNEISHRLNERLVGQTIAVLCEGPSGWKGSNESVTTMVAGEKQNGGVELGPRMAKALEGRGSGKAVVQLTGRTTADQVIVFDGPTTLKGSIVEVQVSEAHGLTLFGRVSGVAG